MKSVNYYITWNGGRVYMACTVSLRWPDQAEISKKGHVSTNKFYRKFETEVLASLVKVLITYRLAVVESISHVWLFETPWTVVCQVPLLFTNSHGLLKFMSIELGMLFNHLILCCPLLLFLQSFPASGFFLMSRLYASGGQSTGVSLSVFPMNIQSWFPLRLTGLISLESKGLEGVFCSTTVQNHQFLSALSSLLSTCHIRIWLLEDSLYFKILYSYLTPSSFLSLLVTSSFSSISVCQFVFCYIHLFIFVDSTYEW